MPDSPSLLEAALDYVRRGLKVVPLHTPVWIGGEWRCSCGDWPCPHQVGKHPRRGYGKDHPCSGEQEVYRAWNLWPDANVGIVIPEGFFVADLDGPEAIRWWEEKLGEQRTETRTTLSGSGVGQHRWYQLPVGTSVRNGVWASFPGIHQQVKVITGGMGYVVVPPSLHHSGGRYAWLNGVRRSSLAPPALLSENGSGGSSGTLPPDNPGELMRQALGLVQGQGRDSLMLRYLGSLHRFSPGAEALLHAARAMDDAFGESLGEEKLQQHVRTILGKEGGQAIPNLALAARIGQNDSGGEGDGRPSRLQRVESDPKVWLLHWPNGVVTRLSTVQLQAWGSVQTQYLEQHRGTPPWDPSGGRGATSDPWLGPQGLLQRLLDAMTDEDFIEPSPEETLAGRVASLCRRRFARGGDPGEVGDVQRLRSETGWWIDEERGNVEFRLAALVAQENSASNRKPMEVAQLAKGVKDLGGRTGSVRWIPATEDEKAMTVKVAVLPLDLLTD